MMNHTFEDDKYICTHSGEDHKKYYNAVVPPILMTSLHLFDTFEDYLSVDVYDQDTYVSASKYLGGHSDLIGGVLVSKDKKIMHEIMSVLREGFGGIIGPMEAWLTLRGIRTLNARLIQHQETAIAVAEYLEKHPKVKCVNYTGLKSHPQYDIIHKQQSGHTGLMSFELVGPPEMSVKFINSLKLFGIGCSWGGYESLALAPLYTASDNELEFLGSSQGLIRIYCGLEGKENLISDLDRALKNL